MTDGNIQLASERSAVLASLVGDLTPEDGLFDTVWPGLSVARISNPVPRTPVPYKPSLCVVVQGRKRIYLGAEAYRYDPTNYLVVPLAMPLEMEVEAATASDPVLGLGLELDLATVSELLLSIDEFESEARVGAASCQKALYVSQADTEVQSALIRLLRLLDSPTDLRILGPAISREIVYRLLQGSQGWQLRRLVLQNGNSQRIANLIKHLSENFSERMAIDDLARFAGMSASSLHHTFREVTGMSPLQYLKKIRLHNARTMMLEDGLQAGEASYRVGYTNPSQFSREFRRMFGAPPGQLVKRLVGGQGETSL